MPTKKEVYDALFAQNYFAESDQQWLGSWLLAGKPISGMRAALIQGDPGTGKTRFTEALAHGFGIPYLFYMCHAWTDDQELFAGIDVAAAVRGDHKQVKTPGVLSRAASMSLNGPVLVCLDEIDKTEDRTHVLCYDFLQNGRAQFEPGKFIQGNVHNIIFCATSNDTKPLYPALVRRFMRREFKELKPDVLEVVLCCMTELPPPVVKPIITEAKALAAADKRKLTLQEMANLLGDMRDLVECTEDVGAILSGWCLRRSTPAGDKACEDAGNKLYHKVLKPHGIVEKKPALERDMKELSMATKKVQRPVVRGSAAPAFVTD